MTSNEFVLWLKGFSEGVHEFNITPKQWDILKDKLAEVEDKPLILKSPITSNWNYTNSTYNPPYTTGGDDEIKKYHNED
jgi:hypothetical protein